MRQLSDILWRLEPILLYDFGDVDFDAFDFGALELRAVFHEDHVEGSTPQIVESLFVESFGRLRAPTHVRCIPNGRLVARQEGGRTRRKLPS